MSWEGWAAVAAIVAVVFDIVRRLVSDAHAKGRRMEQEKQQRKDIDGIGKKVERVRTELKGEIDTMREEHNDLREKVNEIAVTTAKTNVMIEGVAANLDRLLVAHNSPGDMR
jgi:septal ring factor EnvC (AmiA/AmiB activator)